MQAPHSNNTIHFRSMLVTIQAFDQGVPLEFQAPLTSLFYTPTPQLQFYNFLNFPYSPATQALSLEYSACACPETDTPHGVACAIPRPLLGN